MAALASLRAPIDAFFDKVTVNDPDAGSARGASTCSRASATRCTGRGFLEDRGLGSSGGRRSGRDRRADVARSPIAVAAIAVAVVVAVVVAVAVA